MKSRLVFRASYEITAVVEGPEETVKHFAGQIGLDVDLVGSWNYQGVEHQLQRGEMGSNILSRANTGSLENSIGDQGNRVV